MLDTSEALKAFHDMGKNVFSLATSNKRFGLDFFGTREYIYVSTGARLLNRPLLV